MFAQLLLDPAEVLQQPAKRGKPRISRASGDEPFLQRAAASLPRYAAAGSVRTSTPEPAALAFPHTAYLFSRHALNHKGFIPVLRTTISALSVHITADVHYGKVFLPSSKTLLRIHLSFNRSSRTNDWIFDADQTCSFDTRQTCIRKENSTHGDKPSKPPTHGTERPHQIFINS